MDFLNTRSTNFQKLCEGILVSERIDGRWARAEKQGWWTLDVPASDVERAAVVIGEVLQEDYLKREARKQRPTFDETMVALRPAFTLGAFLALVMMVFFYFSGPYVQASELYRRGVMNPMLIEQGQWWRSWGDGGSHRCWHTGVACRFARPFGCSLKWICCTVSIERVGSSSPMGHSLRRRSHPTRTPTARTPRSTPSRRRSRCHRCKQHH